MPDERTRYYERLSAPWWLWMVGLVAAVLLAAEIHLGYDGLRSWVPYVIVLPIAAIALWWLGRIRIRVTDTMLYIDDARLPLTAVTAIVALDSPAKRTELGGKLDPLAFVIHRPWIRSAARIELADPDDSTPYWIISSRCPHALVTVITARRGRHQAQSLQIS